MQRRTYPEIINNAVCIVHTLDLARYCNAPLQERVTAIIKPKFVIFVGVDVCIDCQNGWQVLAWDGTPGRKSGKLFASLASSLVRDLAKKG
jgi:hypothetical protein